MVLNLTFSIIDYGIFATMLLVSFLIGIYHACTSSQNNDDYLLAGKSIGVIPMAISLCASFNSAYMILGIPAEIYTYGSQFYVMILGTGIGVFIAGEVWIPVLYRLNLVSMYEYFELRYRSKFPRLVMTLIFILKSSIYIGIVLYAPTMALASVTQFSWQLCILVLGISSTIYTAIGGMKAVVWTDVFQIFIVFAGIVAIIVEGLIKTGGWEKMWEANVAGGRIELFNMSMDPYERHTFWNVLFGTLIMWGSPYTCSQYLVQRCLCLPTLTKGKIALYTNFIGQFVMTTMVAIIGLIMYAYYATCDPVKAGVVMKNDAIIPLFVLQEFVEYPGVAGLFISCLFSGALSTLDSTLNSLAAVTWEEIKACTCFESINKKHENMITKSLSVAYGIVAIGLAFVCHNLGSLINVGSRLFGACMGPMFGLCLVSVLCPMVNLKGASAGIVVGQILNIWLSFGAMIYSSAPATLSLNVTDCSVFNMSLTTDEMSSTQITNLTQESFEHSDDSVSSIYLLSYNIYPIIGTLTTILVSLFVSLCTGFNQGLCEEDAKYFYPFSWKLYKYCHLKFLSSTGTCSVPTLNDRKESSQIELQKL